MGVAHQTGEAGRIIVAPVGPLIVADRTYATDAPVLSVVVPTLNESENIADFLAAVRRTLEPACPAATKSSWWTTIARTGTWEIAAAPDG